MSYFLAIGRLLDGGANDRSFGANGLAIHARDFVDPSASRASSSPQAIWLDAQGRALVDFTQASPNRLYRLRPDGTLDASFGAGGFVEAGGELEGFWTTPAGFIIALAHEVTPSGKRSVLRRFLDDGSPDLSFGANGAHRLNVSTPGPSEAIYTVAADGSCFVWANFPNEAPSIMRIAPDGTADLAFASNARAALRGLIPTFDTAVSNGLGHLAVASSLGVLATGLEVTEPSTGDPQWEFAFLRTDSGLPHPSHGQRRTVPFHPSEVRDFRAGNPAADNLFSWGLHFDSENRLVFLLNLSGGISFLGRLDADGLGLDPSFFQRGYRSFRSGAHAEVGQSLALGPTDDPLVGFRYSRPNAPEFAIPAYTIRRFQARDGSVDTSFNATGVRVLDDGRTSENVQFEDLQVDSSGRIYHATRFSKPVSELRAPPGEAPRPRVKLTLQSIMYDGQDIGNEWEITFTLNNNSMVLKRALVHGQWNGQQEMLVEEEVDPEEFRRTGRWMASVSVWPFELDLPWDRDIGQLTVYNHALRRIGESDTRTLEIPVDDVWWFTGIVTAQAILRITLRLELTAG